MYNKPIEFHGDVIIIDPCNFMKDFDIDTESRPSWWDFISKQTEGVEYGMTIHHYPKASDYPDCKRMYLKPLDIPEEKAQDYIKNDIFPESFFYGDVSETLKKEEAEFNKANAAWIDAQETDWDRCETGENMGALGFTTFLCANTIYGDWFCRVVNEETEEKIGSFSADAGLVGVFLLDEVLKYNPEFTPGSSYSCVIKNFHGTIELQRNGDYVKVVGKGSINFHSYQDGFSGGVLRR